MSGENWDQAIYISSDEEVESTEIQIDTESLGEMLNDKPKVCVC
jgi:hypothetical protein